MISAFSFKYIEVGSYFCYQQLFNEFSKVLQFDKRRYSNLSFSEKFLRYVRSEQLLSQSFCYEHEEFAMFQPLLAKPGVCYVFNLNEDILNKSKWVSTSVYRWNFDNL